MSFLDELNDRLDLHQTQGMSEKQVKKNNTYIIIIRNQAYIIIVANNRHSYQAEREEQERSPKPS